MKIGNSPELNAYTKLGNDRPAASDAGRTTAAKAAPSEAGTQVELSTAASNLMTGVKSDDGSFDAEKVARIADAIAKGEFKINADAIADKLIANASEVLSRSVSH